MRFSTICDCLKAEKIIEKIEKIFLYNAVISKNTEK